MIDIVSPFLKGLEAFEPKPYLDGGGKPTIGYGSTYYLDGRKVRMSDPPISQDAAIALMETVVQRKWEKVKDFIHVPLNPSQTAAICSFIYNAGSTAFLESTLLKKINAKASKEEIITQFRRWKYDNGQIVQGLINRREKEISLYFSEKKKVCPCCCR